MEKIFIILNDKGFCYSKNNTWDIPYNQKEYESYKEAFIEKHSKNIDGQIFEEVSSKNLNKNIFMKPQAMNSDIYHIMNLVCTIPEIFKPILILESDIPDFDIGFKEFWLKTKKIGDWQSLEKDEYFDYLKSIYSISLTKIEPTDEYYVQHFIETLIMKVKNGNGKIEEGFSYKPKIIKYLDYIEGVGKKNKNNTY